MTDGYGRGPAKQWNAHMVIWTVCAVGMGVVLLGVVGRECSAREDRQRRGAADEEQRRYQERHEAIERGNHSRLVAEAMAQQEYRDGQERIARAKAELAERAAKEAQERIERDASFWCTGRTNLCFPSVDQCESHRDQALHATSACTAAVSAWCFDLEGAPPVCLRTEEECNSSRSALTRDIEIRARFPSVHRGETTMLAPSTACRRRD